MTTDLSALCEPKGIAVIGASSHIRAIGGQPIQHLRENGYTGRIYPVNSKYDELHGLPCYASVLQVPDPVDLAIIAVKAELVPSLMAECGERGIRHAIIFSAGFKETGTAGERLERQIREAARRSGVRFLGPNCQGVMNIPSRVFAGFGDVFEARPFHAGTISMVTQSGGFGYSVVNVAQELGVGFNRIFSTGNEADLTTEDILEYLIEDAQTEIISAYVEGLKHPGRLVELGRRALEARKPLLIWKVGRSEQGSKAAASHTGSMAGNKQYYDAAIARAGILPVDDVYDLVDFSAVYGQRKLPAGNRMGIVTISGGAGVLVSDKCEEWGLDVPTLSESTRLKLAKVIPAFASSMNPIDVTAQIFNDPSLLRQALEITLDDEQIDMLMIVNANMHKELGRQVAQEIASIAARTQKPIAVSWSARDHLNKEGFDLLRNSAVPIFKTPGRGVKALYLLSRYSESLRRLQEARTYPSIPLQARQEASRTLSGLKRVPTEYETRRILSLYGIPVPDEAIVSNAEEAVKAADRIGYPVVLKVMSSELLHKTEAGAVQVGIRNAEELIVHYDRLMNNAVRYKPDMPIDGMLVMPMASGGVECIVGVNNDPQFGPIILFGLGGIFTEIMQDVSFELPPLSYEEARRMAERIQGYAVLNGARGRAAADLDKLVDVLVRLAAFADHQRDRVQQVEINPIFVLPQGDGVLLGDALLLPKRTAAESGRIGRKEPSK